MIGKSNKLNKMIFRVGSEVILVFAPNIGDIQVLIPVVPHSHSCPDVIGATDQGVTQELAQDGVRVQFLYHR